MLLLLELNEMQCRPVRQRVLIAAHCNTHTANTTTSTISTDTSSVAEAGDVLPSITTDADLSDHPLGTLFVDSRSVFLLSALTLLVG